MLMLKLQYIFWPPDVKNWFLRKDPDVRKDWRQEEKGMTKDEMAGWHHRLDGHELEQAPGVGGGQGILARCSPWGCKESDTTEWLNWTVPPGTSPALLFTVPASFPLPRGAPPFYLRGKYCKASLDGLSSTKTPSFLSVHVLSWHSKVSSSPDNQLLQSTAQRPGPESSTLFSPGSNSHHALREVWVLGPFCWSLEQWRDLLRQQGQKSNPGCVSRGNALNCCSQSSSNPDFITASSRWLSRSALLWAWS